MQTKILMMMLNLIEKKTAIVKTMVKKKLMLKEILRMTPSSAY
jgi:hypothetical protein